MIISTLNKKSCLKGVWHEIFDFRFFSWISVPQAPKYTGDKLFSGDNDTGKKFNASVIDIGD